MVQPWEPGTQYNYGDVVEYEGHEYKIIQAHLSQSDWTPPVTPALWGRLQDSDHTHDHHHHHHHEEQQQQQQQPYSDEKQGYNPPPPPPQTGYGGEKSSGQTTEISHEEHKKNWWDLDDKRKKELEVGGGLLAGAALLGAGYLAYKEHGKSEEEKKAQTWALQNWLKDAQRRTADFHQNGPRGPATWVLNEGKTIPPGALVVGPEHDWTLYICRAFHEGSIQVGKASDVFQKGAVIGFKHEEIQLGTYEILLGDIRGLRWVSAHGHLNVSSLGALPVEGGRESDGTPLYIAKAYHKGAEHPGKASEKLPAAFIPYGGTEVEVKDYQVLCYA